MFVEIYNFYAGSRIQYGSNLVRSEENAPLKVVSSMETDCRERAYELAPYTPRRSGKEFLAIFAILKYLVS